MPSAREQFMAMIDGEGYGAWIDSDQLATTIIDERALVEAMLAEHDRMVADISVSQATDVAQAGGDDAS